MELDGPPSARLERCIAGGGVAVFPADTVYGLACDPHSASAVERLYALKGRAADKPAAIMVFSVAALPPLGPRTTRAAQALLPGALTLLVEDPEQRFPLAGGGTTLGLRVPDVPLLANVSVPLLQTSANLAGGADSRRLADVPAAIRDGADLVIDGGELPGMPSTVVDLTRYEHDGVWRVVREGAVGSATLSAALGH
ncbi:MAG TPA: L-threonylcarbamoyladenylate synthase [Solirubrobacteraceae bacterium]|nr:L-threonylcarbamoyladenylate synthase [Solirubrobacteraceae bacterium]